MTVSKLMVRASLVGLALGLIQGCTALPQVAGEQSFTDAVVDSLYSTRVYITGSRIPKRVDLRDSLDSHSAQPLRVIKVQ